MGSEDKCTFLTSPQSLSLIKAGIHEANARKLIDQYRYNNAKAWEKLQHESESREFKPLRWKRSFCEVFFEYYFLLPLA